MDEKQGHGSKGNMISVRNILEHAKVKTSAPCRIDTGGTWDIKAMALPFEQEDPVTVNIAIDLRTHVTLTPFDDGYIRVSSSGFKEAEIFSADNMPLNTGYALFFAAALCFGFHGIGIRIESSSPVRAALGGSSTALVALVKGLSEIAFTLFKKAMTPEEILYLSFQIEDAVSGGNCGMQDHAAATFGGVNLWRWHYGRYGAPWDRKPLLDNKGIEELSEHILVVYSGKTHMSAETNRRWTKQFLSGITRKDWLRANKAVVGFADAISKHDWNTAGSSLNEEMEIRKKITPEALIPVTKTLLDQAKEAGCSARFAGAGAGGCVWAIGNNLTTLKKTWKKTTDSIKDARILDCNPDPEGVKCER